MPDPRYKDPYDDLGGGELAEVHGDTGQGRPLAGPLGCLAAVISALVAALAILLFIIFFSGGGAAAASICQSRPDPQGNGGRGTYVSAEPSRTAISDIPDSYLAAYRAAGEEYGLDWSILAAMGSIESGHGKDGEQEWCGTGPANYTGELARGPMQFLPSTWATVGVDAEGDGQRSACDYEDAIHGAASYLSQSGAPGDYHDAITTYNRSEVYYQEVMAKAESYKRAAGDADELRARKTTR